MKKDLTILVILWLAVTAVGEWLVLSADIFPLQAAAEAIIIDDAFQFLLVLATPVFTFVVVALVYSIVRFRAHEEDAPHAPPIHTSRPVTVTWFVVTSALALFVIFNPGLKGLAELQNSAEPDLVVEVVAQKWEWAYSYPQYGFTIEDADELVLPVDQQIRFEITTKDIIHSFWIPAFRLKIDAVPGQTTTLKATPTKTGEYNDDSNLRVQCAELCGTGHTRMRTDVRIVEQAEFEAWVAEMTTNP